MSLCLWRLLEWQLVQLFLFAHAADWVVFNHSMKWLSDGNGHAHCYFGAEAGTIPAISYFSIKLRGMANSNVVKASAGFGNSRLLNLCTCKNLRVEHFPSLGGERVTLKIKNLCTSQGGYSFPGASLSNYTVDPPLPQISMSLSVAEIPPYFYSSTEFCACEHSGPGRSRAFK